MTIPAVTTARDRYTGDGIQVDYLYTFKIQQNSDLKVEIEGVNGTITTQTLTTHYTVSGAGTDGGGTVTFVTAPASTDTIVFTLTIGLDQATDFVERDAFKATNSETALDKRTLLAQELAEKAGRAVKVAVSSSLGQLILPSTPNGYLRWNSTATALEAVVLAGTGAMTQVADDSTPQLGAALDANGNNIKFDDNTGFRDSNDNEQLIFQKTTSAVNQLEMTNQATGTAPSLSATGGDTNIDLKLSGKGTGGVATGDLTFADTKAVVDTNGNELLKFSETASAINEFTITNAATSGEPILGVSGGDGTISINLQKKGTGVVNVKGTSTGAGHVRLYEDTTNGTNYMGLGAPSLLSSSYTLTLPDADGSNGQIISTNGSGTLSFVPNDIDEWVLLASSSASSSSSVDFESSIDSTYGVYKFVFYDVIPATDDAILWLRVSTDGGSTYATSSYHSGMHVTWHTGGGAIESATNAMICNADTATRGIDSGDTAAGISGEMYVFNPSSSSTYAKIVGRTSHLITDTSTFLSNEGGGFYYGATSAIDAVRFLMSSGNIASGEFKMYGLKVSQEI